MHRDSHGYYTQDFAGESVPCAVANSMEVTRRRELAQRLGWTAATNGDVMMLSDDEIEVAAALQRAKAIRLEKLCRTIK